jgi:hypothetical protein
MLLHWFPLADKAVEPTPSLPSPESLSCTPQSLSHDMSKWGQSLKPNANDVIPHHILLSQHDNVLYHPATHECIAIPTHLHSLEHYLEITCRLDEPVGDYTDPFSAAPVTMYQFLAIWMKFVPAQYHSTYFLHDEVQQKWSVDGELIITILTALERLQHVITDVIGIVGEEPHCFVIDQDSKLTEQLCVGVMPSCYLFCVCFVQVSVYDC